MKKSFIQTISAIVWAMLLLSVYAVAAHAQSEPTDTQISTKKNVAVQGLGGTTDTTGTSGHLTKWKTATALGDSIIIEDQYGKIGVGTGAPTSRLTVAGVIESIAGGVKFPDGTVQTTAATIQTGNPPLQPFAQSLSARLQSGRPDIAASFEVPDGKRLVIETVSLLLSLPVGNNYDSFTIETTVGGQPIFTSLFPNRIFSSNSVEVAFGITQQLKLYADPGTKVTAHLSQSFISPSNYINGFNLVISGYLVDAP
jgi:hypothetical protein